jgi:hypothetical protein
MVILSGNVVETGADSRRHLRPYRKRTGAGLRALDPAFQHED